MNTKQITFNIPWMSKEIAPETKAKAKKTLKTTLITVVAVSVLLLGLFFYGGNRASNFALEHANLSRNQVSFLHYEFDMEHFLPCYQVEWIADGMEYEIDVHAFNGYILKTDYERSGR